MVTKASVIRARLWHCVLQCRFLAAGEGVVMRRMRWFAALAVVAVPVLGFAASASASVGYTIAVLPLSQAPGGSVHVTGSDPLDNCPSTDVKVTLTYFTNA